MEDGTDYEKAVSRIGPAAAAQAELAPVAIDLEGVLAKGMGIRRVDYAEVRGLLESIEAKKAETAVETASKQQTAQKRMELGKRLVGKGVSGAERGLGMAAGLVGKGLGRSGAGAAAAEAARGLGRAARSVDEEFRRAITRDVKKAGPNGLVMPGLSLQDQLSELEQIEAGLDRGAFDSEQTKTIISEIVGLDAAAAKEDTSGMSDDLKELATIRGRKIRDIKSKLNIK